MEVFGLKPVLRSVSNFLLLVILGIMLSAIIFSKDTYASEFKLSEGTLRQYKESSKSVAGTVADSTIEGMFQNDLDSSGGEELRKNLSSYKGANVADAGLDIKKAEDKGARQRSLGKNSNKIECTEDHCELGSIYSSTAVNNRDIAMEEVGFKKDEGDNIIDNKGYLDRAKKITKEASGKFDFIKGEYRGCEAAVTENVAIIKESCDQYYDAIHNSCPINQVVEIDPRYLYQCSKKREVKEKVCEEIVDEREFRCQNEYDCGYDAGGVIRGSVASDMKFVMSYPYLTVGTIADNYWRGSCTKYSRKTTFSIKGKSRIKEFRITNVGFDDYMQILVNGSQVYNGPKGGYKLEKTSRGVDVGTGSYYSCELNTNWNFSVNIDLLPYLREGYNEIETHVLVAGAGEGWMQIKLSQYCCKSWREGGRREVCEYK